MASLDAPLTKKQQSPESGKSFAQALSNSSTGASSDNNFLANLPPKVIMGDSVRVKISQAAYEVGLVSCQCNLHARLTLHKGDSPITTQALKAKLHNLWPNLQNWSLISLGKGFFEFHFSSIEDMKQVWAIGALNLKPGFLRFFCWTKDFAPRAQAQTHAQVWVKLMQLPQEYWGKQTLFEIASSLGTPLIIDEATQTRRFGLFARILVDVNMSEKLFESIIVERDGHALTIGVQYEKYPLFCSHCRALGHDIQNFSKLNAANGKVPQKLATMQHKTPQNSDMATKHDVVVSANTVPPPKVTTVSKKSAATYDNNITHKVLVHGCEEGEIPQDSTTEVELILDDNNVTASAQHNDDNLTIHNSFELRETDTKQVTEEAIPNDLESTTLYWICKWIKIQMWQKIP